MGVMPELSGLYWSWGSLLVGIRTTKDQKRNALNEEDKPLERNVKLFSSVQEFYLLEFAQFSMIS